MVTTPVRQLAFARPWITDDERDAVRDVLMGPTLAHGPRAKAFEAEFARFVGPGAHALTVSSCMAALHLAYLGLGIGAGDEVIVPAQTHVATAHAVEWVGARSVFVDCDPATGNLTADLIAPAITERTKAISVVHFLGIPCEMRGIVALAERHGLKIVEDCALAIGARLDGVHVGLFGDVGTFSFYPTKHITTAEGGMFVTRDAALADAVGRLRAFGVDRSYTERTVPGMYDVPRLGLNYRMSELHAALGRPQLTRIDENLERRAATFARLRDALAGLPSVRVMDAARPGQRNSHYCLSVVLEGQLAKRRDEFVRRLNEQGIGTSIYYPHPVPRLAWYRSRYGVDPARYPAATAISDASIALPVGPHLDDDDVAYLVESVNRVVTGEEGR
jgi:dTDP-4-amino-4,6-dideoxygalactose transaminase